MSIRSLRSIAITMHCENMGQVKVMLRQTLMHIPLPVKHENFHGLTSAQNPHGFGPYRTLLREPLRAYTRSRSNVCVPLAGSGSMFLCLMRYRFLSCQVSNDLIRSQIIFVILLCRSLCPEPVLVAGFQPSCPLFGF